MQTVLSPEQTRLRVAENRYERFEKNKRFEEMTDISERLGYHIDTTLHYVMRDGAAYCTTDTKHRAFHEQTTEAYETGRWKFTGANAFEVERLRLEHEEALQVDALGRGELAGNVLIKVSKVPDAVVDGSASIDGYRRDLLRSFVRIYYLKDGDVYCRLFTLDGNHSTGFAGVDAVLGTAATGRGSEAVLSDTKLLFVGPEADIDETIAFLAEETKHAYDKGVYVESGKRTYAGSEYTDMTDAMGVIREHIDLFNEHYQAIQEIAAQVLSLEQKEERYEGARRKAAAAIKLRGKGAQVDSVGDASVAQEAESGEYGRECATTGMDQAQSAQADKEIVMTCPFCGLPTVGNPCASRIVCSKCQAEVNSGRVVSRGIGRSAALARARKEKDTVQSEIKSGNFKKYTDYEFARLFGSKAIVKEVTSIGGAKKIIIDKYSGEIYWDEIRSTDLIAPARR